MRYAQGGLMSPSADLTYVNSQTNLAPALKAWEMYLNDQGRSPNTIKAFLSDVRLMTEFLAPDTSLGAVTTKDLNRFFEWMEKERPIPCSPKTLARRITSTKSFFRWVHQHGAIVLDPAEKVLQRSAISPLPHVLTDDEYESVLLAADRHRRDHKPDARQYALVYLLLTTGIKKSECLGIHINHIDLEAPGGPQVFIRYASPANRYKERKLALAEDWIPAYREYLAQYQTVDQLFPWSPRRLEYLLEDIGEEAGLGKKHLSFDMCRWTCSLRDYQSGIEIDKVRQKMGISKIQWREIHMKLRQLNNEEK
jgi:site-specific recombinase XerD